MSTPKEIFRVVTLNGKPRPYLVSNLGRVYSRKTKKFLRGHKTESDSIVLTLESKKWRRNIMLHLLVSLHFNEHERKQDSANHINFVNDDNRARNLSPCTKYQRRSRTRARNMAKKGKTMGVSVYRANSVNPYRAVIKNKKGKTVTLGYYNTQLAAQEAYREAYKQRWGTDPYQEIT